MTRIPTQMEWDLSRLEAERRGYLSTNRSFEKIVAQLLIEVEVVHTAITPYRTPARGEPRDARQAVFRVSVNPRVLDQLYNAPDGLRGRYWQSPDHGFSATKYLIGLISHELLAFAEQNPPIPTGNAAAMTLVDIECSLRALSAKVWPRERDEHGTNLLVEDRLVVPRWAENEQRAPNQGMWRRTPEGGELEIKGAILGPDRTEFVPEGKRDRSCQIHWFGFT